MTEKPSTNQTMRHGGTLAYGCTRMVLNEDAVAKYDQQGSRVPPWSFIVQRSNSSKANEMVSFEKSIAMFDAFGSSSGPTHHVLPLSNAATVPILLPHS